MRGGLARATVGSVVFDLITAGLVRETADAARSGQRTGRPQQLVSLEPDAGFAVGFDVGHDHVRAILTDVVGTSWWDRSEAIAVDDDPKRALDVAARLIASAISETAVPPAGCGNRRRDGE